MTTSTTRSSTRTFPFVLRDSLVNLLCREPLERSAFWSTTGRRRCASAAAPSAAASAGIRRTDPCSARKASNAASHNPSVWTRPPSPRLEGGSCPLAVTRAGRSSHEAFLRPLCPSTEGFARAPESSASWLPSTPRASRSSGGRPCPSTEGSTWPSESCAPATSREPASSSSDGPPSPRREAMRCRWATSQVRLSALRGRAGRSGVGALDEELALWRSSEEGVDGGPPDSARASWGSRAGAGPSRTARGRRSTWP